jgi:Tfp pilus assembly protein PilW
VIKKCGHEPEPRTQVSGLPEREDERAMPRNSPRGFTLLELTIAAGIATFVFTVGYYAVSTIIAANREATSRVRDTENARLFYNLLERDLATAYTGPANDVDGYQGPASPYSSNPAPIVVNEDAKGLAPPSDIIQFFCRSDDPKLSNGSLFVRYYVNSTDHTLCRTSVPYEDPASLPPAGQGLLVTETPTTLTSSPASDWAMFDNVRSLKVLFKQWDAAYKRYLNPGDKNSANQIVTTDTCNFFMVTVTFTDQFQQKGIDASVPDTDKAKLPYLTNLNKTYRTYSKLVSIAPTFTLN